MRQVSLDMYPQLRSVIDNDFQECVLDDNGTPQYFKDFITNCLTYNNAQLSSRIEVSDLPDLPDLPELSQSSEDHIMSILLSQYLDPMTETVRVPQSTIDELFNEPILPTPKKNDEEPANIVAI